MTTKTLRFDEEVQNVLEQAVVKEMGDQWALDLVGQLDRKLYARVKKAIEAMGGKWNRSKGTHLFPDNPLETLGVIIDDGTLEVENLGFFPTPEPIIEQMVDALGWLSPDDTYLEPSAGVGAIAQYLHRRIGVPCRNIICVEIHEGRAAQLARNGFLTYQYDFQTWQTDTQFDWVLMNPPFEKDQAMKHVLKAFDHLTSGGGLVSVVPGSILKKRNTELAKQFKKWFDENNGQHEPLPPNSFDRTGVSTGLLWVFKR